MVILKILTRLVVVIVLLLGAALSFLIGIDLFYRFHGSLPPLASGLPNTLKEARREFDRRLDDEFPTGSSEAALVARLSQEGWGKTFQKGIEKRVTFRRKQSLLFAQKVSIFWQADTQGRIVAIRGSYSVK
ncbi:hypothetical protein [Microvirga puerhi]|uniref:DUF2939 domain-containing protein n=1 Tax=Microvirga puerhi TaxID=2876078 RepID=A0ABS7VLS8_9HYPH|nr:hypothetical protein [Microvirga puerhi]MBZ6075967.1 hypothetical protein [Microvirga puerhi]